MKNKLDQYEQEILEAFEQGKLKSTANARDEIRDAKAAVKNSLIKTSVST